LFFLYSFRLICYVCWLMDNTRIRFVRTVSCLAWLCQSSHVILLRYIRTVCHWRCCTVLFIGFNVSFWLNLSNRCHQTLYVFLLQEWWFFVKWSYSHLQIFPEVVVVILVLASTACIAKLGLLLQISWVVWSVCCSRPWPPQGGWSTAQVIHLGCRLVWTMYQRGPISTSAHSCTWCVRSFDTTISTSRSITQCNSSAGCHCLFL